MGCSHELVWIIARQTPRSLGSRYPAALYTEIDQKPSTGPSHTATRVPSDTTDLLGRSARVHDGDLRL
jgi:hypothetical protein